MSNNQQEIDQVLTKLMDPRTIRIRSQAILDLIKQNKSAYFALEPEK